MELRRIAMDLKKTNSLLNVQQNYELALEDNDNDNLSKNQPSEEIKAQRLY